MMVYVIRDKLGKFYTGQTNNIERRLKEHNAGQHKTTKHGKDWQLIFCQECNDRIEARILEKYLKSGSFREKRKFLALG